MFIKDYAEIEKFYASDETGEGNIDPDYFDITWDNVEHKTDGITHSPTTNNQIITFNKEGYYLISVKIHIYKSSGTDRSIAQGQIVIDTGSGYVVIPGTLMHTYNRTNGASNNSMNATVVWYMNEGDKIKVQATTETGSNLRTTAGGSSISITSLLD